MTETALIPLLFTAGCCLALISSYLLAALSCFSRPRLMGMIEEDKPRQRADYLLAHQPEATAACGFLKMAGLGILIYCLIHWVGLATLPLICWSLVTGLLVLLLLEILPQAVARRCPEQVILRLLPVLTSCTWLLGPLLKPLLGAKKVLLRAAGIPLEVKELHEELAEEIMAAIKDQEEPAALADTEREWIENIVELKETTASAVYTPRTDMVGLEVSTPLREALQTIIKAGHSRFPVYEDKLDSVVGIFFVKDILPHLLSDTFDLDKLSLRDLMRPPFFVPETKKIQDLLREFRVRREHMAIVLDEYGGTDGVVTIEDILEEIVGEIEDEFDSGEEEQIKVIEKGKVAEIDARAHVEEVNEALQTNLPENDDYETIGGFVCSVLGRIPQAGESLEYKGARLEILAAGERTVEKLRLQVLPAKEEESQKNP